MSSANASVINLVDSRFAGNGYRVNGTAALDKVFRIDIDTCSGTDSDTNNHARHPLSARNRPVRIQ
jgi:hypothetical protein